MASFDVVSEIDMQEVDNAFHQADKEIQNRFDFRGGKSKIELNRDDKKITIWADDEFKLRSIHQILEQKLAKREIDIRSLVYGKEEQAGSNQIRQHITIKSGLEKEDAKKITTLIKDTKLKVQAQIQDDQVRVTGKKIDDLQECISALKSAALPFPLQYINMRS